MKTNQHQLSLSSIINRIWAPGCAAITGLLLLACTPGQKAEQAPDIVGVYSLVSVDGKQVPAAIKHEQATLEVRAGTFTFNKDGTCSTKTVFVPPNGQEVAREVNATYTKTGSKLEMRWEGAGTTTGTLEGNTFSMNNEGILLVYRK